MRTEGATAMRLLLPAPGFPPLFFEVTISDEPPSLTIAGLVHGHQVVSQADVRTDGEFGQSSTLILGENAVTVRAALSQTAGALAAVNGTIGDQPFSFVNTPSHRPKVFEAPSVSEPDLATLVHWQGVARGLRILALALRGYEPADDPWGASPCLLLRGAVAVGVSSFLTATSDAVALDAYRNATLAADSLLVQGNCVSSVPPLSELDPS